MNKTLADTLGGLRLLVHTMDERCDGRSLCLRCLTCDRVESIVRGDLALKRALPPAHDLDAEIRPPRRFPVPAGRYPRIQFWCARGEEPLYAVVLPFDLRLLTSCLLHDIRPEWDGYFIGLRGVQVQEGWAELETPPRWIHLR
jgi:hypothetical protein